MSGYGRSADNPIRVSGFYEEQRYLECLQKAGRNAPLSYKRLGSCRAEDMGHPVDVYRLGTRKLFGQPVLLYIDIYGERDWRAPEGYTLTDPAPKADEGGELRQAGERLLRGIKDLAGAGHDPRKP